MSAFHSIDAEAELTALFSEQVAAEIDREILRGLNIDNTQELNTHVNNITNSFSSVQFPIVRRVHARTVANEILSVQPLSSPNFRGYHHSNWEVKEPTVLPNGSWHIDNQFQSIIGAKMVLKPHRFPKV